MYKHTKISVQGKFLVSVHLICTVVFDWELRSGCLIRRAMPRFQEITSQCIHFTPVMESTLVYFNHRVADQAITKVEVLASDQRSQ